MIRLLRLFYSGGRFDNNSLSDLVKNTTEDEVFVTERWFPRTGGYSFPLPDGNYRVTLHFAEIFLGRTKQDIRVFDVILAGQKVLENLDLVALNGFEVADRREFPVSVYGNHFCPDRRPPEDLGDRNRSDQSPRFFAQPNARSRFAVNPLSPPCIPPNPGFRDLPAKSKFLLDSKNGNQPIGNTATAIRKGIDARADWIEIDLQLSEDHKLVVFHDLELGKKTNGEGLLSDHTLAELQALKVSVEPSESILSLDDVFDQFHSPGQKWIFDIKAEAINKEVLDWIHSNVSTGRLLKEQFIIFEKYDILTGFKDSGYALGYTAIWGESGSQLRTLFSPSSVIKRTKDLGSKHLILPVIFARESLIQKAHAETLEVWVYGTDDAIDLSYLAKTGVTGFITDRPAQARELFKSDQ